MMHIKGNAKPDFAAKSALDLRRTKVGVPCNDFKHCVNQYIFCTWQDDWNGFILPSRSWEIGSPPAGGA